ncbi:MAG: MlaD family protein [Syntrophales bacterium LBB04]|nr:MlaD family protein [Syntrophales bacterium LBB04]
MFDMKKQLMWSKLRVGVVISIGIGLLLLTVFFAGKIEDLISSKLIIKSQIKDVRGLRRGAPVWVSGIEIGFVKNIRLHPPYGTVVTMSIKESALPYIRNDSYANVITQGLLGDKYIELSGGTFEAGQIREDTILNGGAQLEVKDMVEASSRSLSKFTEFVNKLNTILDHFENQEGTVAKLFKDPSLYDNMKESSATLLAVLKEIKESEGSAKMLIKDPSVYNNLLAASSSLEQFSRIINEGNGTLKKLAESPDIYNNLNSASRKLDAALSEIDAGNGALGTLAKDKKLAGELKESVTGLRDAVDELKELTKDIKAHPKKYFKFSIF